MGNAQACCATPASSNRVDHRVLMVGLDGAGKTTILQSLARGLPACEEPQLNTLPTLSYSVDELKWRRERLLVWDVGGQHKLRNLWRHFYGRVGCLVFVLDSGDMQRLAEAKHELRGLLAAPELAEVPLLVLTNKQDLECAAPIADITDNLQLSSLEPPGSARPTRILPVSAWKGSGLNLAMDWIGEQCTGTNDIGKARQPYHAVSDSNNNYDVGGMANFELPLKVLSQRCTEKDRHRGTGRRQHRRGSSQ